MEASGGPVFGAQTSGCGVPNSRQGDVPPPVPHQTHSHRPAFLPPCVTARRFVVHPEGSEEDDEAELGELLRQPCCQQGSVCGMFPRPPVSWTGLHGGEGESVATPGKLSVLARHMQLTLTVADLSSKFFLIFHIMGS